MNSNLCFEPLVTICIPTYNRAEMVQKTIQSVLDQTYKNLEIIILDDCSTDDTGEVFKKYLDPRLIYIKNKQNLGQFGNVNKGIDLSNGKYIHILHSDDRIEKDFTEKCISFMEKHPNVAMTCSSARVIRGTIIEPHQYFNKNVIFQAPDGLRQFLSNGLIFTPSVIVKKEVYEVVGKFSQEFPFAGDFNQWLKITKKFNVAYIHDAWLEYNIHENTISNEYLQTKCGGYIDLVKIFTDFIKELTFEERKLLSKEINQRLYRYVRRFLSTGIFGLHKIPDISPNFFIGQSLSLLDLLINDTISEHFKKFTYQILVIFFIILSIIPGINGLPQKLRGWLLISE